MGTSNRYDGVFDRSIIKLIHAKAKQLAKQEGFNLADQKDIEQDLAIYLLDRLAGFDPAKAELSTFVLTLINNRIVMMIRERKMQKRDFRKSISLEEPIRPEQDGEFRLLDIMDHERFLVQTGTIPRTTQEQINLKVDTASLIETLPDHLQEVCWLLMEEAVPEVARRLGIHRTTVYKRLAEIRKHFANKAIRDPREG